MALPGVKVEVAFDSGYLTPAASRTWTDISAYVEGSQALTITRGRADETSEVQPSRLALTLDNRDGRFTPRLATGAYYPNVKKWRPIRVTTTYNAVDYVRATGYVAEWAVRWPDGSDAVAEVVVTGVSRMARIGRGAELREMVQEEILADSPWAHYALDDPAGSTTAADSSDNQAPALVPWAAFGGTAATFGATWPLGGLSVQLVAGGRGLQFKAESPVSMVAVVFAFAVVGTHSSGTIELFDATGPDPAFGEFQISPDGSLTFYEGVTLTGGYINTGTYVVDDGAVHVVEVQYSGGNWTLYVDGTSFGSIATAAPPAITSWKIYTIGAGGPDLLMAHIAMYTSASGATRAGSRASAILTGAAGELSDARITRLAGYAGIPAAELATDAGSATIGAQDLAGKTPLAAMGEVVAAENGVLYDAKDGTLTFDGRDARYNVASSFTLDCAAQEVEADLEPKDDDQFLINDVTATANGTPAGHVLDQTSIDDNGYYRETLETVTDNVDDALAGAQWKVAKGADPEPRYTSVTVDVTNSSTAQAAAVLAAEIGTRFTLAGLPSQAPDSSVDLFVEGIEDTITATSHTVKFNTSPATGYDVWTIEDPVFGQYDAYPIAY